MTLLILRLALLGAPILATASYVSFETVVFCQSNCPPTATTKVWKPGSVVKYTLALRP